MFSKITLGVLTVAVMLTASQASAHGWRDDDDFERHYDRKHYRRYHQPVRYVQYPRVVYVPAATYYYAPPQVAYYPQPVYQTPVTSFTWFFR